MNSYITEAPLGTATSFKSAHCIGIIVMGLWVVTRNNMCTYFVLCNCLPCKIKPMLRRIRCVLFGYDDIAFGIECFTVSMINYIELERSRHWETKHDFFRPEILKNIEKQIGKNYQISILRAWCQTVFQFDFI